MAVDLHCHWTPRGLSQASKAGRDWYGLSIGRDAAGREHVAFGDKRLVFPAFDAALDDPAARAAARKKNEGIDLQALLLTGTFWNYHLDEADAARFARELNEEMAEVQRAYPERYRGMAVLPMQHKKLALQMLEDAAGRLGLRTMVLGTNVRGRNLDDPEVLPILEAAAKAGVSIVVHPTSWEKAGEERLPRYNFANSFGSPFEDSLAAMSIVYSGFLDRHPEARIMLSHGGGWIHFGVGRLNLRYKQQAESARPMKRPPAEYLSRLYFDCLVHDEDSLALMKKRAGADHIVIGTDYPGSGDIPGGAVNWIRSCGLFDAAEQELVLDRNPRRFLGIEKAHA